MLIYNNQKNKPLRKALRKNQTEAEKILWSILRNRQFQGLKFFRQYGIGRYILDFYCPRLKLAVEVDGGQHNEVDREQADLIRTNDLESLGIKVLRFWNNEVMQNREGVYEKIAQTVQETPPTPPSPLLKRGE